MRLRRTQDVTEDTVGEVRGEEGKGCKVEARAILRSASRAQFVVNPRQLGIGKCSRARCTHELGRTCGWLLDCEGVVEREAIPHETVKV